MIYIMRLKLGFLEDYYVAKSNKKDEQAEKAEATEEG
jgi:hypothetical protein